MDLKKQETNEIPTTIPTNKNQAEVNNANQALPSPVPTNETQDASAVVMPTISDEEKIALAKADLHNKNWVDAEKLLTEVLANKPNDADVLLCSLYAKYHCDNVEEMLLQIDHFKQTDFETLDKVLKCADKPLLDELLEKFYMVGEFSKEATYETLLAMILPYNFDKKEERIHVAFDTSIQRAHFNIFNTFLGLLDANDIKGYIQYNLAFAESTNVAEYKMVCMKNVLGVDMGNLGALKVLLDLQLNSEEMPVIMKTFEELLRYSPDTDEAIRELLIRFTKKLDSLEHCALVKHALNYYKGDMSNIKEELLDLGFHMIDKGFFEPAQHLLTQVRLMDSENVRAYWGLCLSKLHVKTEAEIGNAGVQLVDLPEYSKYLLLVDHERREECNKFTRSQRKFKIKKRWAVLLSIVATLALGSTLSTIIKEQIDIKNRGFCQMILTGDYYTVVGVEKEKTSYVIPAEYKGVPVKAIGSSAFERCNNVESITIPNSVTEIGSYSFYACKKLTAIDLPDRLTKIGEHAFQYSGLTSVELPNTLDNISKEAFANTPLTSVAFADGLKTIDDKAFNETFLTEVTIPNSLESIMPTAFNGCQITTATLPSFAVVALPKNDLTTVTVTLSEGETRISDNAFSGCSNLVSVTLPDGLQFIGNYAFKGCTALQTIDLPESVISIGMSAFEDCTALESIDLPKDIYSVESYAFKGCVALQEISIFNEMHYIGEEAFADCDDLIIYCEALEKPDAWYENWCDESVTVEWGYAME